MTDSEGQLLDGEICGPHCDARILHAPGECATCDRFPLLQKARDLWGIAFTGHPLDEDHFIRCPAEDLRSLSVIERWPGNRPTQPHRVVPPIPGLPPVVEAPSLLERATLEHNTETVLLAHRKKDCSPGPCPIHRRTRHHMRSFVQIWRDDRGIMERICPHGVGHPDPDCRRAQEDPVHGCDGCCVPPASNTKKAIDGIRRFGAILGRAARNSVPLLLVLVGVARADAPVILFEWTPATGPVESYEVVKGARFAMCTPIAAAYLRFPLSQEVTVRACDAPCTRRELASPGDCGPWSVPSDTLGGPDLNRLRQVTEP